MLQVGMDGCREGGGREDGSLDGCAAAHCSAGPGTTCVQCLSARARNEERQAHHAGRTTCTLLLLLLVSLVDICAILPRETAVAAPFTDCNSIYAAAREQRHRATSGWHASWPPSPGTPLRALAFAAHERRMRCSRPARASMLSHHLFTAPVGELGCLHDVLPYARFPSCSSRDLVIHISLTLSDLETDKTEALSVRACSSRFAKWRFSIISSFNLLHSDDGNGIAARKARTKAEMLLTISASVRSTWSLNGEVVSRW